MVILLPNIGLIHSILILFLKILFTQFGKINMGRSGFHRLKACASSTGPLKNLPVINLLRIAKFSDPNIRVINEDSDGMIWVGSHSGGLCRFDRQTGKFLPEYFDLGYRQLPGDKAGLTDDINCIYKDQAGTLWVGNTTGLHKIILTAVKAGKLSGVSH